MVCVGSHSHGMQNLENRCNALLLGLLIHKSYGGWSFCEYGSSPSSGAVVGEAYGHGHYEAEYHGDPYTFYAERGF